MKMRLLAAVAGLLAASAGPAQVQPNLEGLWAAHSSEAPIGGTLLIFERGGGLVADIGGFQVPVQASGKGVSFALPDAKGRFHGIRNATAISGYWVQGTTPRPGVGTPVTLRAAGRGQWRGEVNPLVFGTTWYLPLTRSAKGNYSTYLRNPERNLGVFIGGNRLDQDGETVRLMGAARGRKEERVIAVGKYDADNGTIAIPLNGQTANFTEDKEASSPFYPRTSPPPRYHYSPPVQLADGWPVSTLQKESIDRAGIEKFVQFLLDMPQDGVSAHQAHSLLIARHGKLVLEEYFHGANRDQPHDLRSASKAWTSMLIGAAMQSGVPIRVDTPVYQTFLGTVPADLDPRKKALTLEHLITMTAGFDCDDSGDRPGDEDVYQQQDKQPDWYKYMLDVPMAWNSGDKIVYCSGKPNLAAGMLQKIAGEPLPEMFERLIARPLHMSNYHYFLQPTGEAYGGGGHRFTSRDFLKWAQLMNNGGTWEGKRIFSKAWAEKSGAPLHLLMPKRSQYYGYLWNSKSWDYQGRKVHAYFAGGNGGQVSVGIPELDLAIVFTGGNYADGVLFNSTDKYIPESILPAVK